MSNSLAYLANFANLYYNSRTIVTLGKALLQHLSKKVAMVEDFPP